MRRIALTGGIASGKTAVATAFAALGVPVIDTDQISRDVRAPGTSVLAKIVAEFGEEMLDATGHLDTRRMRERIFADPLQREKLNAITHPAIRDELARRATVAGGDYQIHAIPLFVESGGKGNYDRVLVIDCPEDLQLKRLVQRDGVDTNQARQTLAAQATRQQRVAMADDVIVNDGGLDALHEQVRRLHRKYLELAARRPEQ